MSEKQEQYTEEILELLHSITNKRARIVIDHILENGFITTETIEKEYGYNHPPRAARDVREAGIPLITYRVKSSDGRSIAAYKFGDFAKIKKGQSRGRRTFPKHLKNKLYKRSEGKCYVCGGRYAKRYLQVDHRIPYGISANDHSIKFKEEAYMLLCGSCNRAKSWSCEHCKNWENNKDPKICTNCYWFDPQNYNHVAMKPIRRLDLMWEGKELEDYEELKQEAHNEGVFVPAIVKKIIMKYLKGKKN